MEEKMKVLGVCILTTDVIKLSDFYKTVLQTDSVGDSTHMEINTQGAAIAIYNPGNVHQSKINNIQLGVEVDDVDSEFERLSVLGITITQPPETYPWGRRAMQIQDLDGNYINLSSPAKEVSR
ncbi:MAG: VOC family protein [Oscillospiraceae bacterium]|jgi:predicted enzyme related to lactoylglutathione lyase|nr:VOC family protein [Oscillospiraceae bacterium]